MQVYIRLMMFLYLFICLSLLAFNVFYIFWLKISDRRTVRKQAFWSKEIELQLQILETVDSITPAHRRLLEVKLVRTENLIAYNMALEPLLGDEAAQNYLRAAAAEFRYLTLQYLSKDVSDRAFFAYILSLYGTSLQGESKGIASILLQYLPDSSIYCRENVLKALYALGSSDGVERAYDWMYHHHVVHPSRLLSDGLATFAGDRLFLANRLWSASQVWGETYQIAVIQMVSQFTDAFRETFAALLLGGNASLEVAFAALRYFRKYPYEPLREFLYQLVLDESDLAIAAVSVLPSYPGQDTKSVLLKGLSSRNWYIRRNAASSLVAMGVSEEEINHITDPYAKDMIQYMLQLKQAKGGVGIA